MRPLLRAWQVRRGKAAPPILGLRLSPLHARITACFVAICQTLRSL
jgi:hypothetical protein